MHGDRNRERCWTRWALAALLSLLLTSLAWAKSKVAPDLQKVPPTAKVDVIVQFTTPATDQLLNLVLARGGTLGKRFTVIHGALFKSFPAAALTGLANSPNVVYISPNRNLQATSTPDYGIATANAPYAWGLGLDGSGVGVAVIDSGISPMADLNGAQGSSRVVYSESFVDGSATTSDPYGHGTHVAGIVAGNGAASTGSAFSFTFTGMAPNASLINLRALDENGGGSDTSVISAIQAAVNLRSQYNIRVINLSLGRQIYESYATDPLCQAVEAAWNSGIAVVVAAGNQGRNNSVNTNGYGTIASPANDPLVITVGAMRPVDTPDRGDDLIATYSSKGPSAYDEVVKPDLVAPGNRIVSLLAPNSRLAAELPSNVVAISEYSSTPSSAAGPYMRLSGTSMAAPLVSGAAALMLQQDPTLSPDTVKARLMKSASKTFPTYSSYTDPSTGITYTSQYDIFTVGAGYLDVQGALAATDVVPASESTKSPSAAYDSQSGNIYILGDSSVVWGSSVSWGSSVVWGSSVSWGSSTSDGFSVIWGSSVSWGSSTQSASSAMSVLGLGDK